MSLPRMSWHIGDYKKDTGHLRAAGHGAYFLLCMHYWATGGLPDDDRQLAAIACMTDREWKQHKSILRAFFKDGWRHKRIDEEIALANTKYEKRAAAGKQGGKAKANGKLNPSNATANDIAKGYQPITDNHSSEAKASGASAPHDPKTDFFRRSREVLGSQQGGSLGAKLLKSIGNEDDPKVIAKARARIEDASTKSKPAEWLGAVLRGQQVERDSFWDPQAGIL